jgi:hypothetical protein
VAHVYNPTYTGGWYLEDRQFKASPGKR